MGFQKIGLMELVVILIIALVVFGPSRLPGVGKAIGRAINEFKTASREDVENKEINDEDE